LSGGPQTNWDFHRWRKPHADPINTALLDADRLWEQRVEIVWDGIRHAGALNRDHVAVRHALADATKRYDWSRVMEILRAWPNLVNTSRPGGSSLYAPLHQAAHGGSPVEVVEELVAAGAWRTLQNARGERPCDVAETRGHRHLLGALEPVFRRRVPTGVLLKIQVHFHAVILDRAANEIEVAGVHEAGLRLPELEPLLEIGAENVWFPVPGMYGGFSYKLHSDGVDAVLISESWCRLSDGSGQRHEITSAGSRLVATGFV
jgi:hypothetical protein